MEHTDVPHVQIPKNHYFCVFPEQERVEVSCAVNTATPQIRKIQHELRSLCDRVALLDIADAENFMPEDLEPDEDALVEGVTGVLDHEYKVEQKAMGRSDLLRVLNGPIISAIDRQFANSMVQSAMILCAGDGHDIDRILFSNPHVSCPLVVHSVSEPSLQLKQRMGRWPGKVHVLEARTVKQLIERMPKQLSQVQVIIANYAMHHMLGSTGDRKLFPEFLQRFLSNDGVLIGTAFNTQGAVNLDMAQCNRLMRSIEIKQMIPPNAHYPEGRVRVEIMGQEFLDPVVHLGTVYEVLRDFFVNVVPARMLFHPSTDDNTLRLKPPGVIHKAQWTRPELQLVWYMEVKKRATASIVGVNAALNYEAQCNGYNVGPTTGWKLHEGEWPHQSVGEKLQFEPNRGRALLPEDILYLAKKQTLYGEKLDGMAAHLFITSGASYLLLADGTKYINGANGVTEPGIRVRVQCEVLNPGTPQMTVVAVDMYSAGPNTPTPFIARYLVLAQFVDRFPLLSTQFRLKEWTYEPDRWIQEAAEGIVVQNGLAPPGLMPRDRCGSARYVKRDYTIDVVMDKGTYCHAQDVQAKGETVGLLEIMPHSLSLDLQPDERVLTIEEVDKIIRRLAEGPNEKVIVEITLCGAICRIRTDKRVPNSFEEIDKIRRAIPLHQFMKYYEMAGNVELDPEKIPVFLRVVHRFMEADVANDPIPPAELVHLWVSRHDDFSLFGGKFQCLFRKLRDAVLETITHSKMMRLFVKEGSPLLACLLADEKGITMSMHGFSEMNKDGSNGVIGDVDFLPDDVDPTTGEPLSDTTHPPLAEWLTTSETAHAEIDASSIIVIDPGPPGIATPFLMTEDGKLEDNMLDE